MYTTERVMFNVLKPEIYPINNQNSLLISHKKDPSPFFSVLSVFFFFFFFFFFFLLDDVTVQCEASPAHASPLGRPIG
jgi:hypothetical protein